MKVQVKLSTLKAANHCAATKDTRYYINGVLFQFQHGEVNSLYVVSTDGHHLSAFREDLVYEENAQSADFEFIIPIATVKLAIKAAGKVNTVLLEANDDGSYSLAGIKFFPIDGKFPDYRRVIPYSVNNEPAQLNPKYVQNAWSALIDFYGNKNLVPKIEHNGVNASVIHAGQNNAVVVIMAVRSDVGDYQGLFNL